MVKLCMVVWQQIDPVV